MDVLFLHIHETSVCGSATTGSVERESNNADRRSNNYGRELNISNVTMAENAIFTIATNMQGTIVRGADVKCSQLQARNSRWARQHEPNKYRGKKKYNIV